MKTDLEQASKKSDFLEYLNKTGLSDINKRHTRTMFEFFNGEHPAVFSNRIFLFEGEPGVGKTFLAKKLVSALDKPVIFLGQNKILKNSKQVKDLKELLVILEEFEEGIVYIDDLKYVFNFTDFDELNNEDRHKFMKILESFKDNNKRTILVMTLNDSSFMDASWNDRIDIHINFGLPSNENKLSFLKENFSDYAGTEELRYLSENTMGYNYRDLPQILKFAYYEGDKEINLDSIKETLPKYIPKGLTNFDVKQGIKLKLGDLFLKDKLNADLKKALFTIKMKDQLQENNANRSNFLIFEGPSGVGKTYSALALAGEIGIPLIKISANEFYGKGYGIPQIFNKIKRFQDTIVLIDDADKIIRGDALDFNDGGPMNSELNSQLDNLEKASLVILSVNDSRRLGRALRDRFKIVKFDYPEIKQRESYFRKMMKDSKVRFDFSEDYIAKITEGMNYRDMQRFWNECIFYSIENNMKILTKDQLDIIISGNAKERPVSGMFG